MNDFDCFTLKPGNRFALIVLQCLHDYGCGWCHWILESPILHQPSAQLQTALLLVGFHGPWKKRSSSENLNHTVSIQILAAAAAFPRSICQQEIYHVKQWLHVLFLSDDGSGTMDLLQRSVPLSGFRSQLCQQYPIKFSCLKKNGQLRLSTCFAIEESAMKQVPVSEQSISFLKVKTQVACTTH